MISIVIVTHNMLSHSRQCIESVLRNTDLPAELFIVDSGSQDGTPDYIRFLQETFTPTVCIRSLTTNIFAENVGAAIGYNAGFQMAAGDPIIRIDNDVVVPLGWASKLVSGLQSNPRLGMLTAQLITDLHQELPCVSSGLNISYHSKPVWHDSGIGSWCMAINRRLFEEVGFYRTLFGPYALQDNDLEKRAQNAGWLLGYLTSLTVGHLWSMDMPDEAKFNEWKIAEYSRQVKNWERVWLDPTK